VISVAQALAQLFTLVTPPGVEQVPLTAAMGRVLARPVTAHADQPPFAAAAMDGYALADTPRPGATLHLIGTAAAGAAFDGAVGPGQAVRIMTGAPIPQGAMTVVIQEDVARNGDQITILPRLGPGSNIRAAGNDFRAGAVLTAPRRLGPADIALAAAMGHATVPVSRRPEVAVIATGDELVVPGQPMRADQIAASNSYGLHALLQSLGALPRLLPIARDTPAALAQAFALAAHADLVLTIGGASVGDHDLVAPAASAAGFDLAFHKVAMRPGKPLMAGRSARQLLLGLPGNPVSAMVCGQVFLAPLIRAMQGLPPGPAPRKVAVLAAALPGNGPREHYLRARQDAAGVTPFDRQDSALLSVLAAPDCLIVQPADDPPRLPGDPVEIVLL